VEGFPGEIGDGGQEQPCHGEAEGHDVALGGTSGNEKNRDRRESEGENLEGVPQVGSTAEPHEGHEQVVHEHCVVTEHRQATDGVEPLACREQPE
jgi:hypothetical protein